jgi:hypothetical protein
MRSADFFVLFRMRKNCHSSGRSLLLYLFIGRIIKLTIIIIKAYYRLHAEFFAKFFSQDKLYTWKKWLVIISVDFDVIDYQLIRFTDSSDTGERS